MGIPTFPDDNISSEDAVNLLLASIAYEELGLAHIINAEGEKIQLALGLSGVTIPDLLEVNDSVRKMLKQITKKENVLEDKLEDIIEVIKELTREIIHKNTATVTANDGDLIFTDNDSAYYFTVVFGSNSVTGTLVPQTTPIPQAPSLTLSNAVIGPVDLGDLTDFLFFFQNGGAAPECATWQEETSGYIGDVAVKGTVAEEHTTTPIIPYAGTIYTDDSTLSDWQTIVDGNPTQASGVTGATALISSLETDLVNAFLQINALSPTPGYESVSSTSLDGFNSQNGIPEIFVINITSGLEFNQKIYITGDAFDVFILRWDTDPFTDGYQGQVKPKDGAAIVPLGGLTPTNFINVAGDIDATSGSPTPLPPYPQGPRENDGQGDLIDGGSDFNDTELGGSYFTGYWLTTGSPDAAGIGGILVGPTTLDSAGIFVGGWYTLTTCFRLRSGASGVYVSPNPATVGNPSIDIEKLVSPDNGMTYFDADTAPGPAVVQGTNPKFKYIVTNTGDVTLTNIEVTDNVFGTIGTIASLVAGESQEIIFSSTWQSGQHTNTGTVTGEYFSMTVTDSDDTNYYGVLENQIEIIKYVSVDNGVTWLDANTPKGPFLPPGTIPQFKFVVTNTGSTILTEVTITDDVLGLIAIIPSLDPGASKEFIVVGS